MANEPPQGPYQPKSSEPSADTTPEEPARQTEKPADKDQSGSLEDASRSTADYAQKFKAPEHHNHQKKPRRWLKLLIVLIVLGVLGGGSYWAYLTLTEPLPQNNNTDDAAATPPAQTETEATPEEITQETYTSTDLNLSLKHPSNWTVTDTKKDVLELESPETELVDEAGEAVQATAIIRIVPTSASLTSFPSSGAVAARNSVKFAYTAPAEGQRQETMLSFVNSSGSEEHMNGVYITGDNTYAKGGKIAKADFANVQPIISVEFLTTSIRNIAIDPATWDSNQTLQDAFDILKSLNIQ